MVQSAIVLADRGPVAPSKAAIWRVITGADAEVFDAAVGSWLMGRLPGQTAARDDAAGQESPARLMPVRLDGKTARGAKDADGNQRHLLAVLAGRTAQSPVIAAQAEVGVKTNEVPMATQVPGQIWDQVPIAHTATDRGHGRITTRTIQLLPAPEDLPFPHVSQVYLIERHVTGLHGNPVSAVAAPGVASPAPGQLSAADLAWHVREQWAIESLHWLRDTLYQEDKSQVRTRSGPRVMAALRNLAICTLRLSGRADVTEATRWASRSMDRPFAILGLTS